MIKYFVCALLIITSSTIIGSDDGDGSFEPDLGLAIVGRFIGGRVVYRKNAQYFASLTPEQQAIYKPQINDKIIYGALPIEHAAAYGQFKLAHCLLSNGAKVADSDALKLALKDGKPKMVALLLKYKATTDGLLIEGHTPLDYLKDELDLSAGKYCIDENMYIESRTANIKAVITILEEHESDKRWSPARAAWCGAAWRGCEAKTLKASANATVSAVKEPIYDCTIM